MVQKGNPHQLPIRQHSFPAKSISRFCGENGGVEVCLKGRNLTKTLRPNNALFIVERSWDTKAEGHFKEIEDPYQEMVDNMNLASDRGENKIDHGIATRMYASWFVREHFNKIGAQRLNGVITPAVNHTQDEREKLEKAGIMTVNDNCEIAGHQMAWPMLVRQMDDIEVELQERKWGLLKSGTGEFIVPDKPPNNIIALPISPHHILVLDCPSQDIPFISVKQINAIFLQSVHSYYFARKISMCPI